MRFARSSDKQKVVKILAEKFSKNPTLLFLIRNEIYKSFYIEQIASYAFDFAIRRKGVMLSDSENGVAIFFKYNFMKKDLVDVFNMIKLVIRAFAIRRIITILRHTSHIERIRPENGNFYYFWFFGALPEEKLGLSARELSKELMQLAHKNKLDIYAETTISKNKSVYERFGFEVYDCWFNPANNIQVWFMRKPYAV